MPFSCLDFAQNELWEWLRNDHRIGQWVYLHGASHKETEKKHTHKHSRREKKSFINVYSLDFCYVKRKCFTQCYALSMATFQTNWRICTEALARCENFFIGNQTIRVEAISFPNFPFALISVSNWYTQANHIFATATKTRPNLFARDWQWLRGRARAPAHAHIRRCMVAVVFSKPHCAVGTFFTAASQNKWRANRFKHLHIF